MLALCYGGGIDEFLSAISYVDSLLHGARCLVCRRPSEFKLLTNNSVGDAGVGSFCSCCLFRRLERGLGLNLLLLSNGHRLPHLLLFGKQFFGLSLRILHVQADLPDALHVFLRKTNHLLSRGPVLCLHSEPLKAGGALRCDDQGLVPLVPLLHQFLQQVFGSFRVRNNPLKSFLFLSCLPHAFRHRLEHTALGGLLCPFVGVCFVSPGLRTLKQRDEQRILCDRLQRCRNLFSPAGGWIVSQAVVEESGDIRLRRQERGGEKARRQTLAPAGAARFGNAPT